MKQLLFLLAVLLSACPLRAATEAALHSPWDASPVAVTETAYRCRPVVHAAADISITGDAAKETLGTNDAAYRESTAALNAIVKQVVRATQVYQSTGSRQAALCALEQFQTAAADRVMTGRMADKEAVKLEVQALQALSIAYLVLQPSGLIPEEQQNAILGWMNVVLRDVRKYYDGTHCGPNGCAAKSHQFLEVAVAGAALGIAEQDQGLYRWAMGQYRDGVGRIDNRGMLHYDTIREYALKFHIASAAALVQLAEFGEANGEDLYAYRGGRIHALVHTVTRGLIDPRPFEDAAGHVEQVQTTPLQPGDIGWAIAYNRRFSDPVIASELRDSGAIGTDDWVGDPQ